MPVSRIEQIVGGKVMKRVVPSKTGKFRCFPKGMNTDPVWFTTLDEVADYLRTNLHSGVRMQPGDSKIVDHIHIDGLPR